MLNKTMKHIITKEFILSSYFEKIMMAHTENDDLFNNADTKSYQYRHTELTGFGAWRWLAIYQNRHLIADYIFSDKIGIDWGGYAGPIYGNSIIVDMNTDYKGPHSLKSCGAQSQDYIFSSNTLEHVDDVLKTLQEMHGLLRNYGKIIILVPSWTNHRWRKKHHRAHKHTFCLEGDENAGNEGEVFTTIEPLVREAKFTIKKCGYSWENGIFIFAEREFDRILAKKNDNR